MPASGRQTWDWWSTAGTAAARGHYRCGLKLGEWICSSSPSPRTRRQLDACRGQEHRTHRRHRRHHHGHSRHSRKGAGRGFADGRVGLSGGHKVPTLAERERLRYRDGSQDLAERNRILICSTSSRSSSSQARGGALVPAPAQCPLLPVFSVPYFSYVPMSCACARTRPCIAFFELRLTWPAEVGKNSVEGVELVEVTVAADRRAWPSITRPLPIVQSLACAGGQLLPV
jgi:hypothetical protein